MLYFLANLLIDMSRNEPWLHLHPRLPRCPRHMTVPAWGPRGPAPRWARAGAGAAWRAVGDGQARGPGRERAAGILAVPGGAWAVQVAGAALVGPSGTLQI